MTGNHESNIINSNLILKLFKLITDSIAVSEVSAFVDKHFDQLRWASCSRVFRFRSYHRRFMDSRSDIFSIVQCVALCHPRLFWDDCVLQKLPSTESKLSNTEVPKLAPECFNSLDFSSKPMSNLDIKYSKAAFNHNRDPSMFHKIE